MKHRGRRGGGGERAAEHYAKICTVSTVVRWASATVVCAAADVSASWFAPICNSSLIMCDSTRREQVEAAVKGRGGRCSPYRDRPSPDITEESIDADFCTFSADPAIRGGIFGQLPMAPSLSYAHSVTIIPPRPISMLLATALTPTQGHVSACTHTITFPSKMHLSPVVLWHWTVCWILGVVGVNLDDG